MLLGLDLKTWLGLGVLGAVVSMLGSLLGVVLKEYFFSRSFERWRQRQALEQLYQKFRDPLLLSARELASRTTDIINTFPTVYLNEKVLASRPQKQIENTVLDPYFQRYKLTTTLYRLSAFAAWVELYRQDLTYLHSGNSSCAQEFERAVSLILGDLADGQLNQAGDWQEWRDAMIFREELRAIGESLIEDRGTSRTVMGYGRYCEDLESDSPNPVQRWSPVVLNFILHLESTGKDFRVTRFKRLLVHLVELMQMIDKKSIEPHLEQAYAEFKGKVL
jgi:hypothetical protein